MTARNFKGALIQVGLSRTLRKTALARAAAGLLAVAAPFAVVAQEAMNFSIPAQPLEQALRAYEAQARQQLRFDAAATAGRTAPAVTGSVTPRVALERLLAGSGLAIASTQGNVVTLAPAATGTPAAANVLPTMTVSSTALDATTENSGSYTTGGLSIGKAVRSLRETPQSVSVITRYRLDDQNMRTIDDALLNAPGIIAEYQSSTERRFYSRGFEIDQIQYDGVPAERGNGFSTSPDLAGYDRVEILRGPAGLFNGAGQPGGTVNLVRKRPTRDQQFQAQARVGSWNFKRVEGDLSMPLNAEGTLRGRVVAVHEDREFFYDYADAKKNVFYAIVEADLGSPNTTLGAGINYENTKSIPFYNGLPRYSNGADLGLPRSTYTNGGWSVSDIGNTTLFVDLNHKFNDDWRLKVAFSRMREDNTETTGSSYGTINPVTGLGGMMSGFDQHLVGDQTIFDANLNGTFEAFGRRHDLLVGANYQLRDYDVDSQAYSAITYNPFTYNPRNNLVMPRTPSRPFSSTTAQREQYGLYGSLRMAITDKAKLLLGGRVSSWDTTSRNRITGATTSSYRDEAVVTPFAAVTYDVLPDWTAYASYAEIFRSQADRFTVAGERLDPVTGYNQEVGLKGELLDKRLNASVALFRTIEENRSAVDQANPSPCAGSPTLGACYVSDGKVRSQGLDAELTGMLTPRWQIATGYTFNQTLYLRQRANNGSLSPLTGTAMSSFTPKHLVRVWTAYRLPGDLSAWTLAGGVNFQTRSTKRNDAGTINVAQPTYAVWNARVNYQVTRNVSVALNLNNIFDKVYYRTIGTGTGNWYGEPRNVMASLQASF